MSPVAIPSIKRCFFLPEKIHEDRRFNLREVLDDPIIWSVKFDLGVRLTAEFACMIVLFSFQIFRLFLGYYCEI